MATATWDSVFEGNPAHIRKMLFGSVLIKDYDPAMSLAAFTPFMTDGTLDGTVITTWDFQDVGYLDENGIEFTPNYTTVDTTGWQSRMPLRTDVTADNEEAKATFLESTPIIDALYNSIALANIPALGSNNYRVTKSITPQLIYRTALFIGIDGSGSSQITTWRLYPKCLMTKPDKSDWQAKTEVQRPMTFTPYPDPVAGFPIAWGTDGPGWRSMAPTPPAP